ncbi:hypothetical protein ANO11243_059930 [Dothideomycetidae sp. 11243]|nr:hypothetical protein ANO11243_059930 [fungal sp. No.11243]
MPDRPLQIAAYAAGASLAAATLVYVFGPTFFLDDDAAHSSKSSRKRGVVGLSNPANDCFINSVLQTLAGLPELRLYLIRELHIRALAGKSVYDALPDPDEDKAANRGKEKMPEWKILSLQRGVVTSALKEMLDSLNERPIYKKTLSASAFVTSLEQAFRTRINRNQQDAQELLQLVTERLCDEYHAGRKAKDRAAGKLTRQKLRINGDRKIDSAMDGENTDTNLKSSTQPDILEEKLGGAASEKKTDDDSGFPFEGKIESEIECTFCHFKPKPSSSSFVTLTLHVPQGGSATSLAACFDSMLKVEHIDDFKCARCRIQHAIEVKSAELRDSSSEKEHDELQRHIGLLQKCITEDPEAPPKDVPLPDIADAPRRKIARHSRISVFPAVLAIHLSRSMWDTSSSSAKNLTKVSFAETLPLGGILDQVNYRLLGVVTHKGGHNSGHYESLRRQAIGIGREPYSTPTSMGTEGVYSVRPSPKASGKASPALEPTNVVDPAIKPSRSATSLDAHPPVASPLSSSTDLRRKSSLSRVADLARGGSDAAAARRAKKMTNRWWRISDDKIKECSTKDVLGMQREVYLLFFEMLPRTGAGAV